VQQIAKSAERDDRRGGANRLQMDAMRAAPAAAAPAPRSSARTDLPGREREAAPMERRALAPASAGSMELKDTGQGLSIKLQPWRADAPYAKRMREAEPAKAYRVYLDEKPGYAQSTAFYLDAADLLFSKNQAELALRVLSNLAEMDLENRH